MTPGNLGGLFVLYKREKPFEQISRVQANDKRRLSFYKLLVSIF